MKLFTYIALLFTLPINFSIIRYNYSYFGDVIHSAPGLSYAQTFSERTLGTPLVSPEDLVVFEDFIYIISSGSNKLVVVNDNFNLEHSITQFPLSDAYRDRLFETTPLLQETLVDYRIATIVAINEARANSVATIQALPFLETEQRTEFNADIEQLNNSFIVSIQDNMLPSDIRAIQQQANTAYSAILDEAFDLNEEQTVEPDPDDQVEPDEPIVKPAPVALVTQPESLAVLEHRRLNAPMGLDVKNTGIYIADTGNRRILKANHNFEIVDVFSQINDITFDNLEFAPLKITTDTTGRMYVIARDVFEGIIELDTDGSFNRYTGVNPIRLSPVDIFNRFWMTDAQIDRLPKFLPTSYTNVTMSPENFIYATSLASTNNSDNMIQLINPKGIDVLVRNGYHTPKGDIQFIEGMNNFVIQGPSRLVDIALYRDGIYTVLDSRRSRLFTYDSEGNLLYINGEAGQQLDKFSNGVALGYFGDNLLVLDRELRTVIVYEHTEFGQKVNQAIYHHERGEFELAAMLWEEVLVLNTNYEVAYNGIGKFHLRNGDYQRAMEYFRFGYDKYYYSRAYKSYRNEIIKDNFGYIFIAILAIPAITITLKQIKKRKDR